MLNFSKIIVTFYIGFIFGYGYNYNAATEIIKQPTISLSNYIIQAFDTCSNELSVLRDFIVETRR